MSAGGVAPVALTDKAGVEVNDPAPGAVVGVQGDRGRRHAERSHAPLRELHEVLHRCAAEAVERLVVVTHDAEVAAAFRQAEKEPLLDTVGVLVLVHDDVLKDRLGAVMPIQDPECLLLQQREIGACRLARGPQRVQVGRVHAHQPSQRCVSHQRRDLVGRQALLGEAVEERQGVRDRVVP